MERGSTMSASPSQDNNRSQSSSTPATNNKKRYPCPECHQEFSRLEHMKRHRQLHLAVPRPYKCKECERAFTRQDALYRHLSLHKAITPRPVSEEQLQNPRRRAAIYRSSQACERCSRLKLKCTGENPCSRCKTKEDRVCVYPFRPNAPQRSNISRQTISISESVTTSEGGQGEGQGEEEGYSGEEDSMMQQGDTTFDMSEVQEPSVLDDIQLNATFADNDTSTEQDAIMEPQEDYRETRHVMVLDPALEQIVPAKEHMLMNDFENTMSVLQASTTSPSDILPSSEFDWLFANQSPNSGGMQAPDAWAWSFFIDSNLASHQMSPAPAATQAGAIPSEDQQLVTLRTPLELLSSTALRSNDDEESQQTASQPQQRSNRIVSHMEPRDLRAPSRRNSMPGSGSVREWPNSWYPDAADMRINADFFEDASEEVLLLENTAQVDDFDETAKARMLSICELAELPDHEAEQVFQMLCGVSVETYNIMVQLFFEKFEPNHPFVHRSTFCPAKCNVLLLGAVCAIGTFYTQTPKARNLGNVLIDLVHRAIIMSTTRNNLHARSLSNIQALVLICIYFGNAGNRRFLEHAEACRSAVITMVRRCRLLDNVQLPAVVMKADVDKETRWKAWLHWETGRRTGWACFVSDMELSSTWTLPPSFLLNELQTPLPSSEDVWEAPNAEIWSSVFVPLDTFTSTIGKAHSAFESSRLQDEYQQFDVFQSTIVTQSLSLLSQSVVNLSRSKMARLSRLVQQEFFMQIDGCADSASKYYDGNNGKKWATVEILLHFIVLRLYVDLHDLQALGGRRGTEEGKSASTRLSHFFTTDFEKAHAVAQHCARTIKLVMSQPIEIASLSTTMYYSVVYLYAFSTIWSKERGNPKMRGSKIIVEKVGELASPTAPIKLLNTMSHYFLHQLTNRTWPTCKNLGVILSDMAITAAQQMESGGSGSVGEQRR